MRAWELKEDQEITQQQLDMLEYHLDRLYSEAGIDVDFSHHFIDRVNDSRNVKPITISELQKIFTDVFNRYKNELKDQAPGFKAVMSDISTELNIPFVFGWDDRGNERDLIPKTVMRKKDFKTPDEKFIVGDK